jgi:hypothetical protein
VRTRGGMDGGGLVHLFPSRGRVFLSSRIRGSLCVMSAGKDAQPFADRGRPNGSCVGVPC